MELDNQGEPSSRRHRLRVAQALLKREQGDLDGALDLLYEAERLYVRSPLPVVRPIPAMKARIRVAQGRLSEARSWASERGLSADDELGYLLEFEHVTLARLLLARNGNEPDLSIGEALGLLERLLEAAQEGGRPGSEIEILALRSLAFRARDDIPSALAALERALTLAEPEGCVRVFADEGPPMAELLTRLSASPEKGSPGRAAYIRGLLAAFEKRIPSGTARKPPGDAAARTAAPLARALREPLSERELEVLGLIGRGLSNREIGERLFLALDTIKGYNRRIFDKLDVKRRTEALARARELGLL